MVVGCTAYYHHSVVSTTDLLRDQSAVTLIMVLLDLFWGRISLFHILECSVVRHEYKINVVNML